MSLNKAALALVDKGEYFVKQKNYSEALESFVGAYQLFNNAFDGNKYMGVVKFKIGICYYWKSNYNMSINHLMAALKTTGDEELRARITNMLSVNYLALANYNKCIEYCENLMKFNSKDSKYKAYSTLGLISYYQKKFNKAHTFYEKALHFAKREDYCKIYNNMAMCYADTNNFSCAVNTVEKARKYANSPIEYGEIYNTHAEILIKFGRIKEAVNKIEQALGIFPKEYQLGVARCQYLTGKIHREQKRFDLADHEYSEALIFLTDKGVMREAAIVAYELFQLYEGENEKKAREYYSKYKILLHKISQIGGRRNDEAVHSIFPIVVTDCNNNCP